MLWVGSRTGIAWYDPRTDRFHHYKHAPGDPTSVARGGVTGLAEDHIGNLWVGTVFGLSRMGPERDGKFQNYDIPHRLGDSEFVFVFSIEEDPAGFIWLGTRTGVVRLDPLGGETKFYGHDPNDPQSLSDPWAEVVLVRDREPGAVWVATSEGGLNRLDVATGKFRHWLKRDGLADNVLYSMVEDSEGRLWLGTQHGLSRFDPETETFRNYGLEIGLQSLEFTQGAATVGLYGEMFFGGVNGVNSFFPNALSENINPPEVTLVDLKLFNESVRKTGAVKLDRPLNEIGELQFDYTQRDITFDFVALHYADSENNEFAYKMDGFNDDWVYIGKQRSASFTNLPPGEYTFHVKAANSDGVWNEAGTSIRLTITPPFWATWWFRVGALLVFGGLVYGGVRMRIRQIAERNRLLESEVEKRTAQLKESNDQLEQSHTIVEAINQETSFRRLLTKILEEARVIPGVEKATALVYMYDEDVFRVRASSGWDVKEMQNIKLTKREAKARYVDQAEEVGEDIYVAKNVAQRSGADQLAEYGKVASFLVLRVRVDDDVAGYLVFDNLTNEDAFEQRDVALLERLKEHIQSAFIKTRILEDLQNTLSNLRSTQDRLVQAEKMASLGQLTAGIAHEIKNPLNFVNNFSEVTTEIASDITEGLARHRDEIPEAFREELEGLLENLRMNTRKVAEHGKRADAIVQNMLEHSKSGEGERHPTDLNDLLDEYVTLAHHGLEARGGGFKVKIERHYDEAVGKVDVVPQELGRVFMNLIGNAFDALKEHGSRNGAPTVTVSTARVDDAVEVTVSDNGPGIPPKVKARIFEPFFTTKPTGSGTGLGLSMSYDIV
ncbi:MAG TPA: triple tyrosine motif-containing protein, partial [Rhodothermia bacterium]|nr:triple tyrosine motif-containing protein [Rhodothermia bacterium]